MRYVNINLILINYKLPLVCLADMRENNMLCGIPAPEFINSKTQILTTGPAIVDWLERLKAQGLDNIRTTTTNPIGPCQLADILGIPLYTLQQTPGNLLQCGPLSATLGGSYLLDDVLRWLNAPAHYQPF